LSPDAIKRVNDIFDQYGPIPRLCIDYLDLDSDPDSDPDSNIRIAQYKKDGQKAIASLKLSKLEQSIEDSGSLTMDELSHKICLISREDRERVYSSVIVSPITLTIKSRLANHFRTLEHREQICLYKHFFKVPDSRAMAGIFFEAAGQRCLQHGVTLHLVPMVRRKEFSVAYKPCFPS
jgi:chromatin segregation and condensation protein Rec8/ScpA/Scc1 (kleisin family)